MLDKDRIAGQIPFHGKLAGAGIPGAVLPLGADVLWLGFSKDLLVKMDLKSGSQSVISDLPGFRKQIPGFYNFSKLFTLDEKTVWVAGTPGYFRFDPESLTVSDTFRLNLPDPVVYDILPGDSGDFWISSHGRIIHVIGHQVKSVTTILENHFNIVSLHNDRKGALWLALHGGGIVRFDMSTLAWRVYTRKDGLVNNSLYEILGDNRRNLWISSNTGISRFNPSTGEFWNFGTEDGLQIREFNGNAACSTPEGELLFGGMGGITRWFPDSLNNVNQKKSGTVMISMVKVAGVPVITDSAIYEKRVLHLPAGSDNLTFYFTCTDLRNASQLSFRYRLQGYEAAWAMADRRSRTCNFVNLGPGQYIFSVEASDAMGQWSRRTALTVIIPPLFHQTLLFRFLLFFSGILFLIFMVSWYIYQVKLAERKKQELIRLESLRSQLNPHFIFNALNPLNYMISSRDVPGANQYLADFSRLLRLFLTNSRSEFIHIGQEVETLQKYLTVEQARFGSMFDFDIVISQKLLDKMPEVAPSMVQPFLENSIMHGFCKKSAENKGLLTACFEPLDSGFVLCIIEDNGIGIAAGEIRTREHRKDHVSQGIKILEERLSLYNSMYNSDHKIRMEEVTPGAEEPGTRILLPVPINRNIKK